MSHADIGDIYNGMLGLSVTFEYEGCGAQGLGSYTLDGAFVIRFINAIGARSLSETVGRSCWVTHTHDRVISVEPLHKKDGKPFVISEWQEWVKRRVNPVSYHELETGKQP